jgi:hypothetical protein
MKTNRAIAIPGFPGYSLSEDGCVTCIDREVRLFDHAQGYTMLNIKGETGEWKSVTLHRLVYTTFNGIPYNEPKCVMHIDDDPSNNSLKNLKGGDHKENAKSAIDNDKLKYGEDRANSKLKEYQVKQIVILRHQGMKLKDIAKLFDISITCICDITKGRTWTKVTSM